MNVPCAYWFAAICAANVYLYAGRKAPINLGLAVLTGLFLLVMLAQIVGRANSQKP